MLGEEAKTAVIDGPYRYLLTRQWDAAKPLVTFLMLNPSTADAVLDDSTTRSCRQIAMFNGFGGMIFVNLYAYRSKNPDGLYGVADPVGPENDAAIRWAAQRSPAIVLAWGNRGPTILDGRIRNVLTVLRNWWSQLYALGATAQHQPIHPRFLPKETPIRRVDPWKYLDDVTPWLEETA